MALIIIACLSFGYTGPVLITGLLIFGFVFALNSSFHSYLILDLAHNDKAAMTVGFYYMANAIGRLLGTLLSGVLYHFYDLIGCLIGSLVFLIITNAFSTSLGKEADDKLNAQMS